MSTLDATRLDARERLSVWGLFGAAGIVATSRYFNAGVWTADRAALGYALRPATIARIRERLGPGAFHTPNATGAA